MKYTQKITAIILCAALCGCADAPVSTLETSAASITAGETTAEETSASAITSEETTTASTTAETTVETTTTAETEAETEETIDLAHLSENERTNGYMAALLECELFNKTLAGTDEVQITDLNADGVPEILLCCAPPTVTAVFSFDENGKCVFIEPSEDSYTFYDDKPFYSYDGFTLEPYSKDGKDIFITQSSFGGSSVVQGGYMEVSYENGKIVSKPLCGYSYTSLLIEGINGSEYWFGSTDNTMNEEEYNKELEEYLAECEPSGILLYQIPRKRFYHADYNEMLKNLAKALDEYFEESIDAAHLCENEQAKWYMSALLDCEKFADSLDGFAEAQIIDMNSDGTPEIVFTVATLVTLAKVFSFDENGNCVYVEPSDDSDVADLNSYDGNILEPYSKDGKDVFIARSFLGGSVGGQVGYMEISYENGKIVSKPLCGYSYHQVENGFGHEYVYWFGSSDNTMSEDEYNKMLADYLAEYETSSILSRHIPNESFCHVDRNEKLKNLAKALDEYFETASCEYNYSSDWQNAYAKYLDYYPDMPAGILIEDINGDGRTEMVIMKYSRVYISKSPCIVLYYNTTGLHVTELDIASDWGYNLYNKETGQILNNYFYGHTQGTYGALEYYIYDWDGEDYIKSSYKRDSGYYYRDSDNETEIEELGQAYINDEPVDEGVFLAEEEKIEKLEEQAEIFPFVLNPDYSNEYTWRCLLENNESNFEEYLKEKLYY